MMNEEESMIVIALIYNAKFMAILQDVTNDNIT